jgi:hypothetical protein
MIAPACRAGIDMARIWMARVWTTVKTGRQGIAGRGTPPDRPPRRQHQRRILRIEAQQPALPGIEENAVPQQRRLVHRHRHAARLARADAADAIARNALGIGGFHHLGVLGAQRGGGLFHRHLAIAGGDHAGRLPSASTISVLNTCPASTPSAAAAAWPMESTEGS